MSLWKTPLALEEAGAYAVVLECVPAQLARMITERLNVPTIGIGAGAGCDGQVQVFHDLLGLYKDFTPKHARKYAQLGEDRNPRHLRIRPRRPRRTLSHRPNKATASKKKSSKPLSQYSAKPV